MIYFYDSKDILDSPVFYEVERKIILDPFCEEALEGFELADSVIRDNLDLWVRHFQWLIENNLPPVNYRIVTEHPEIYKNHGLENYIESSTDSIKE